MYLLLLLVVVLSRLPYIWSDNFILNGDQSILGIMAMKIQQFEMGPGFFVGQQYGFSFFESLSTSIAFTFFGSTDYVFVMVQLVIFSLGLEFLRKLFVKWTNHQLLAFIGTLVIGLLPAFHYLSLGAYPLYVSAFSSVAFLMYLLECSFGKWRWLFIGVVLVISYFIHPIWGIGMMVPVLHRAWRERSNKMILPIAISGVLFLVLKWWSLQNVDYWHPEPFKAFNADNFALVGTALEKVFSGWYYLNSAYSYPVWVRWATNLSLLLCAIAFLIGVFQIVQKKNIELIPWLIAPLLYLLLLGFLQIEDEQHGSFRYLAPLILYAFVLMMKVVASFNHVKWRKVSHYVLLGFWCILVLSSYDFRQFHHYNKHPGGERKELRNLLNVLNRDNYQYAYATGPLVQWQVMFYSRLEVLVRFTDDEDRMPDIAKKVDDVFLSGGKVVVIGRYGHSLDMETEKRWHDNIEYYAPHFFYYPNPDLDLLKKGKYNFTFESDQ